MRIILDGGTYDFHNAGDVAMTQAAVLQLRRRFPDSEIMVFNDAPAQLAELIGGTTALATTGRFLFCERWCLLGALHHLLPQGCSRRLAEVEDHLRLKFPKLSARWAGHRLRERGGAAIAELCAVAGQADLVVATGGGYITDAFPNLAMAVLRTLGWAKALGKKTAMLGQGIGPISRHGIMSLAKDVLPTVDLIALRERLVGEKILRECGVKRERITVTGDDAIVLAFTGCEESSGMALGLNLRVAEYANVGDSQATRIVREVSKWGREHGLEVVPLPVSTGGKESDLRALTELMAGSPECPSTPDAVVKPDWLIRQVARCKVVVTGSYHAGVFALAQGIPVVGLVGSGYYRAKFEGLADQFGTGVYLVQLGSGNDVRDLGAALDRAWDQASSVRPLLIESAKAQMRASQDAYDRLVTIAGRSSR
jgi:polysaccharide pyruvyl transferase WcaK-like protein